MAPDLEHGHGERVAEDRGIGSAETSIAEPGVCKEKTVARHEAELDKGEGDWVPELVHDLLAGV